MVHETLDHFKCSSRRREIRAVLVFLIEQWARLRRTFTLALVGRAPSTLVCVIV
jgi:hypothetical protein